MAWEYLEQDLQEAHFYAQRAHDLADKTKSLKDYGDACMRLGAVFIRQSLHQKAIPLFEEAIQARTQLLSEATDEEEKFYAEINLAGAYENLALAQYIEGDFIESSQNTVQAIALLKSNREVPEVAYKIASFYNNRADVLQMQQKLDLALIACDSAKAFLKGLDQWADFERGRNLLIEAQIQMDFSQCGIAKDRLKQAEEYLAPYSEEAYYLLQLAVKEGIVAKCEGKIAEALDKLNKVYPQAKEIGQTDIIQTVNSQLIEIYLQLNETDSARSILNRQ
ncbi:MAG: hypothetical protein AAFR59_16085, partial [Bacteroidota bacterium]